MKFLVKIFNLALGVVLIIAVTNYIISYSPSLSNISNFTSISNLVFAFLIYNCSHLIRSIRLTILTNLDSVSLREIVKMQYYTNGINLVLPFKLGEIYRIIEFNRILKNGLFSTVVIAAERSGDFFLIFSALLICIVSFGIIDTLFVAFVVGILFLLAMPVIFFILPENIKSIKILLLKRYNTRVINKLIFFLDSFTIFITKIKSLYWNKIFTIVLLSLLIWSLEVGAIYILFNQLSFKYILLLSVLIFLSSLLPNGPAGYGGIQLAFYSVSLITNFPYFIEASIIYTASTFIPAILISSFMHIVIKTTEGFKGSK